MCNHLVLIGTLNTEPVLDHQTGKAHASLATSELWNTDGKTRRSRNDHC